jgi:hypothetical protein
MEIVNIRDAGGMGARDDSVEFLGEVGKIR